MPRKSKSKKGSKGEKKWQTKGEDLLSLLNDSHSVNEDDFLLMEELAGQTHDSTIFEDFVPNLQTIQISDNERDCENNNTSHTSAEGKFHLDRDDSGNFTDCETEAYTLSLEEGRGLGIVSVEGEGQYRLDQAALASLLAPSLAELPAVVISVAGAFRGGKSFLLDFFLRYLYAEESAKESGEWLGGQGDPLRGFSWRGGCERDTTGLVLWSQPIPATLPSGEKVVIILMDTQGSFDDQSSLRDCSMIFALSTLLSSVQIYNISQKVKEDDLQHLQLFTDYAALGGGALQSLTLLVRDWCVPYQYPYGRAGGERYLRDKLQVREEQPLELREIRQRLAASFERLDCFLLPHPGLKAANDPGFKGQLSDLTEDFKHLLLELVPLLLAPQNLRVKTVDGHPMKARDLAVFLQVYLDEFNNRVPTPQSVMSATATAQWLTAAAAARKALFAAVPQRALPRELLLTRLQDARAAALAPLGALAALAHASEALADLEKDLDSQIANYVELNLHKIQLTIVKAKEVFEEALRPLEDERLCVHSLDLAADLEAARARAMACYDGAVDCEGIEDLDRTQLLQKIEEELPNYQNKNSIKNQTAQYRAFDIYVQSLNLGSSCWNPLRLAIKHEDAQKRALDHFFGCRRGPNSRNEDNYLKALKTNISRRYNSLHKENEGRNETLVNRAVDIFRAKMNDSLNRMLRMSDSDMENELQNAFTEATNKFRENSTSADVQGNPVYEKLKQKMYGLYDTYRLENAKKITAADLVTAVGSVAASALIAYNKIR